MRFSLIQVALFEYVCFPRLVPGLVFMVVARQVYRLFLKSPSRCDDSIFILPSMSPVQAPLCTTDYPRTRVDAALIRAEFLHPDAFFSGSGTSLEEESTAMRKRAERFSQYKLPTYQASAVVVRTARIPFLPVIRALTDYYFSPPHSPLSLPESNRNF
jgi:hypothetical protein